MNPRCNAVHPAFPEVVCTLPPHDQQEGGQHFSRAFEDANGQWVTPGPEDPVYVPGERVGIAEWPS